MNDSQSKPKIEHHVKHQVVYNVDDLLRVFRVLLDHSDHESPVRSAARWGFVVIGVTNLACVAAWTYVALNVANLKTEVAFTLTAGSALVLVAVLICGTVLCRSVITAKTERDIGRMEAFANVLRAAAPKSEASPTTATPTASADTPTPMA